MKRGSCLCGTVKWSYEGETGQMSHCHCSICRKMHAAPYGTYFSVPAENFQIDAGEDAIRTYETSPGFPRDFCSKCGSVVPFSVGDGSRVPIPVGCLDDDPGIKPTMHIFAPFKSPWVELGDELERYDAYPSAGLPEIPEKPRSSGAPDALRGSCQCGGIVYEVQEPFVVIHNCHCSRCRKARAAPHTTNGFVPEDRFRFIQGADLIDSYKVPEAISFTQNFCKVCGSGMPRIRKDMGMAIVPMATLDDAPSQGPDDHIFVDYKAEWFDIVDDLPRFKEGAS